MENVHLSESLMRLSYRVCSMQDRIDEEKEQTEMKPARQEKDSTRS